MGKTSLTLSLCFPNKVSLFTIYYLFILISDGILQELQKHICFGVFKKRRRID